MIHLLYCHTLFSEVEEEEEEERLEAKEVVEATVGIALGAAVTYTFFILLRDICESASLFFTFCHCCQRGMDSDSSSSSSSSTSQSGSTLKSDHVSLGFFFLKFGIVM